MIEFLKTNSASIPFAIAVVCNLWVGLDTIYIKKCVPMGTAYLFFAAASVCMCWHYLTLR